MSGLSLSLPPLSPHVALFPHFVLLLTSALLRLRFSLHQGFMNIFFIIFFLFLRVTPCSSLTARLSGQNCSLSEMQLWLDFFGSGCQ